jgi:hypothetical protein
MYAGNEGRRDVEREREAERQRGKEDEEVFVLACMMTNRQTNIIPGTSEGHCREESRM